MTLKVISLFCGCGGLDFGFAQERFRTLLALDYDPAAVRTYNHNHGKGIAQVADLSKIGGNEIIQMLQAKYPSETIRGVIGGPPCQSFSNGNAYFKADDKRHTLPRYFAAILKSINDYYNLDFFVFENVEGITSNRHAKTFAHFKDLFEDAGFTLYEALLDAQHFKVPQRRPRVLVVGLNKVKFDKWTFKFPEPDQTSVRTVASAISSLPAPRFFERGLLPENIPYHHNHWAMNPRSPKFRNGFLKNGTTRGKSFRVLSWDEPSYTVAYGHNEVHIHPTGERRLSVYEAMLLQGFPAKYELLGTLTEQIRQVSNAVPPPLARSLARSIRIFLEGDVSERILRTAGASPS